MPARFVHYVGTKVRCIFLLKNHLALTPSRSESPLDWRSVYAYTRTLCACTRVLGNKGGKLLGSNSFRINILGQVNAPETFFNEYSLF